MRTTVQALVLSALIVSTLASFKRGTITSTMVGCASGDPVCWQNINEFVFDQGTFYDAGLGDNTDYTNLDSTDWIWREYGYYFEVYTNNIQHFEVLDSAGNTYWEIDITFEVDLIYLELAFAWYLNRYFDSWPNEQWFGFASRYSASLFKIWLGYDDYMFVIMNDLWDLIINGTKFSYIPGTDGSDFGEWWTYDPLTNSKLGANGWYPGKEIFNQVYRLW
jgi:hypothetical protein